MKTQPQPLVFSLSPTDNRRLAALCGQFNAHLKQIESHLGVSIANRAADFSITGDRELARQAERVLRELYDATAHQEALSAADVHLALRQAPERTPAGPGDVIIRTRKTTVQGRNPRQRAYLRNILAHDLNFGIGPAGTGKTYLAVACATHALEKEEVSRIILVRPAVEAGERLGFLPGDLGQKVDPYLRPLYDALYEMLGFDKVAKLLERDVIELAPLAYMRGRTLNDAFVILDEAQNTTAEQMKMFLTRLGFGTTTVITGDLTQTDLPRGQRSGLKQASELLQGVAGISFTWFQPTDVVRHPLVQKIVEAYARLDRGDDERD